MQFFQPFVLDSNSLSLDVFLLEPDRAPGPCRSANQTRTGIVLRSSDSQVLGRPQKPFGPGFFTHKARGKAEWPLLFFLVWRFYREKMSSWKEEVQFSFWWAARIDGTFTMPCFLIVSIGGPPAVSPSRVRTFQRLESLPLLEHPSANWPFPSHTLCLFLGSRRVRGEQEDSR